jgi:secreted PhoX family phosphatase
LNSPEGLAFDSAGNLYAANLGNNSIEKYTPGGSASVFASTGLSNPVGLAFDSAGNLYAAKQANSTIEEFTPGGSASLFANSANGVSSNPHFLAFTNDAGVPLALANQVPEPATWVLLAMGGAVLLFQMHSRKRSRA